MGAVHSALSSVPILFSSNCLANIERQIRSGSRESRRCRRRRSLHLIEYTLPSRSLSLSLYRLEIRTSGTV